MSKFNRQLREAKCATALGEFSGEYEGAPVRCAVLGALRSHGYQSDFQHRPTFWVFVWRAGQEHYSRRTVDWEQIVELVRQFREVGLTGNLHPL